MNFERPFCISPHSDGDVVLEEPKAATLLLKEGFRGRIFMNFMRFYSLADLEKGGEDRDGLRGIISVISGWFPFLLCCHHCHDIKIKRHQRALNVLVLSLLPAPQALHISGITGIKKR